MKCLSVFAASNGAFFEPENFIIYGSGSSLSSGQILFAFVLYSGSRIQFVPSLPKQQTTVSSFSVVTYCFQGKLNHYL